MEKKDTGNKEEEESSAYPACFISLNISLGTEHYSKTDYSKLDRQILKDAVKSILLLIKFLFTYDSAVYQVCTPLKLLL